MITTLELREYIIDFDSLDSILSCNNIKVKNPGKATLMRIDKGSWFEIPTFLTVEEVMNLLSLTTNKKEFIALVQLMSG